MNSDLSKHVDANDETYKVSGSVEEFRLVNCYVPK